MLKRLHFKAYQRKTYVEYFIPVTQEFLQSMQKVDIVMDKQLQDIKFLQLKVIYAAYHFKYAFTGNNTIFI